MVISSELFQDTPEEPEELDIRAEGEEAAVIETPEQLNGFSAEVQLKIEEAGKDALKSGTSQAESLGLDASVVNELLGPIQEEIRDLVANTEAEIRRISEGEMAEGEGAEEQPDEVLKIASDIIRDAKENERKAGTPKWFKRVSGVLRLAVLTTAFFMPTGESRHDEMPLGHDVGRVVTVMRADKRVKIERNVNENKQGGSHGGEYSAEIRQQEKDQK